MNFRPVAVQDLDLLDLNGCVSSVRTADVSLRGWNYPHVPSRNDDRSGVINVGSYVEAWTDWMSHRELWRMYTSTQFLHYRAVNEDWLDRERGGIPADITAAQRRHGATLGIISCLWHLAEVFEFVARLHQTAALYRSGAAVVIELHQGNQLLGQPRTLRADERGRVPLSSDYTNYASLLSYQVALNPVSIDDAKAHALDAAQHFLGKFGWTPKRDLLATDLDRLYQL